MKERPVFSLADISASGIAQAIEKNLVGSWSYLGKHPDVEVYEGPDMLRFISGVKHPLCNGVFRANLDRAGLERQIEEALSHFKTRGLPMFWWAGPSVRPKDIGVSLIDGGLSLAYEFPGMAADLSFLKEELSLPPGLTIERVTDKKSLASWIAVFRAGFQMPDFVGDFFENVMGYLGFEEQKPMRYYLGFLDKKPVACASLFLGEGVAGLYNITTLAPARGTGIGTSMSSFCMREAVSFGYRVATLHATQMGLPVYNKLGFSEYGTFGAYRMEA